MRIILSIQLLFVCISNWAIAQDSLRIDSKLSLELEGQHNLATFVSNFDCFHCPQNRITNNPIHHLGIYFGLTHHLTLNKKYHIETGIFAEERSHSGGSNTLSNLIFFPKILISAADTVKVFNREIRTHIKGGDYWDEDVDDILRLYNIDYNGLIFGFQYQNWLLNFMTIGDLSKNVGLDFPQQYRTSILFDKSHFRNAFHISLNELSSGANRSHVVDADWNLSNYTKYQLSKQSELKGQVSLRLNSELGASIGSAIQVAFKTDELSIIGALRYYQEKFNQGYNGRQPRFIGLGQFKGPQLYPLKNFYRPFSQWAVYTHMADSEILAFALQANWTKHLYKNWFYFNDIDLNLIGDLTDAQVLFIPFYNIGFQCKFLSQFTGRISATNKHMELRTFYHTSSASKVPFISLGLKLKLDDISLGRKLQQ